MTPDEPTPSARACQVHNAVTAATGGAAGTTCTCERPTQWAYEQVCKANEKKRLAIADLTEENERLKRTVPCESCGVDIRGTHSDNWCYGCQQVVCAECVTVFCHIEDGLHGSGDPAEALADLTEKLAGVEAERDELRGVVAEWERQVDLLLTRAETAEQDRDAALAREAGLERGRDELRLKNAELNIALAEAWRT